MRVRIYQLNKADIIIQLISNLHPRVACDIPKDVMSNNRSTVTAHLWFLFGYVSGVETKLPSPSFSFLRRGLHILGSVQGYILMYACGELSARELST
jgi:hypothetical protein